MRISTVDLAGALKVRAWAKEEVGGGVVSSSVSMCRVSRAHASPASCVLRPMRLRRCARAPRVNLNFPATHQAQPLQHHPHHGGHGRVEHHQCG